jgi:hypothetical protein
MGSFVAALLRMTATATATAKAKANGPAKAGRYRCKYLFADEASARDESEKRIIEKCLKLWAFGGESI